MFLNITFESKYVVMLILFCNFIYCFLGPLLCEALLWLLCGDLVGHCGTVQVGTTFGFGAQTHSLTLNESLREEQRACSVATDLWHAVAREVNRRPIDEGPNLKSKLQETNKRKRMLQDLRRRQPIAWVDVGRWIAIHHGCIAQCCGHMTPLVTLSHRRDSDGCSNEMEGISVTNRAIRLVTWHQNMLTLMKWPNLKQHHAIIATMIGRAFACCNEFCVRLLWYLSACVWQSFVWSMLMTLVECGTESWMPLFSFCAPFDLHCCWAWVEWFGRCHMSDILGSWRGEAGIWVCGMSYREHFVLSVQWIPCAP